MIKESILVLALSSSLDLYTTEKARDIRLTEGRSFNERNVLCDTTKKCIIYTVSYTAVTSFITTWIDNKFGKKAGIISLVISASVPILAAISNQLIMDKYRDQVIGVGVGGKALGGGGGIAIGRGAISFSFTLR